MRTNNTENGKKPNTCVTRSHCKPEVDTAYKGESLLGCEITIDVADNKTKCNNNKDNNNKKNTTTTNTTIKKIHQQQIQCNKMQKQQITQCNKILQQ